MIGQTLSHYRITAALGAGGMGEVYRATDTNLGRDVAIKVLPAEVVEDPERLGRFKREAHLLAALNHPSIAAIHGLEEAEGKPFLVLELVEGEDLKERLARGAIPVDETLEIGKQIAEALEEAHSKGIVHRDLKPANVKLTPDSKVKVLDFGLAKAWAGEAPEGGSSSAALSQSPTLAHSGTVAGVILGTAAYMSPEQARGRPVDKRADVWSFGVLLWEMLAGRTLFAGDTVTDIIASVVKEEPDLTALPAETPREVRRLIARCLRKDPRVRLPDIGAARLELQDALAGGTDDAGPEPDGGAVAATERRWSARGRWTWSAVTFVAGGLAALLGVVSLTPAPEAHAVRFAFEPPGGGTVEDFDIPVASPDGRRIALPVTSSDGTTMIWLRSLDSTVARPLSGTEYGWGPFWSPDGGSLAFFAEDELRRISLASGTVQRICTLPDDLLAGGTWSSSDIILCSAGRSGALRLYSVAAGGGEAKAFGTLDESRGEESHLWPQFLPDGRRFLFQVFGSSVDATGLYVASLEAPDERRRLLPTAVRAQHDSGHLLFVQDRTLLAQPFDTRRAELTGEPVAVASSVSFFGQVPGWGWFSVSPSGVLAYQEGQASRNLELVWFDRQGTRLATVGKPGQYGQIALSPDESRVAVELATEGASERDIWTIDLARGVPTRVTFDPAIHVDPVWSPDGREILYSSLREDRFRIYRKSLEGNEPESLIREGPQNVFPESWSPASGGIVYHTADGERHEFGLLAPEGDGEPETILAREFALDEPHVSPDGRWLAFISEESGQFEVYVEPYRRVGPRERVSPEGGGQPRWRGDGKELFYVSPDGQLMAVDVRAGDARIEVGLPVALFAGVNASPQTDHFAVTADGQRFLVTVPVESDSGRRIHVVTNWTSLLE